MGRAAGTGTVQWARTNISMAVDHLAAEGNEKSVSILELDISGNSVRPQRKIVRRRMWVTDPEDSLNCPLEYRAHPQEGLPRNTEVQNSILRFLSTQPAGDWVSLTTIRDTIGGRKDTVRAALTDLVDGKRLEQTTSASGLRAKFRFPPTHTYSAPELCDESESMPF